MRTSSFRYRAALLLSVPAFAIPVAASVRALTTGAIAAPVEGLVDTPNSTADVVAHAVVDLVAGSYRWTSTPIAADVSSTQLAPASPTFLLAEGAGTVLVTSQSGTSWLLADGEAVFRPAGSVDSIVRVGVEPAGLLVWGLEAAEGDDSFVVDGGRHDVELLRDVVGPGDVLVLPAGSLPTLAMSATEGALARDSGTGAETGLAAGQAVLFDTPREITVADGEVAVVALVIGPSLAAAASETAVPVTEPTEQDGTPGVPSTTAASPPSSPTTVAPTTTVAPVTTRGPLRPGETTTLPPSSTVAPTTIAPTSTVGGGGGGGSDCNPDGPGGNPCVPK